MLGLDTGNPEADAEAEMWIMGLIGVLAAAIPVAFLNPSLGFRRRRREAVEEQGGLLRLLGGLRAGEESYMEK
jgi:hypothetical protein